MSVSLPTLFLAFLANFVALGVVWSFVLKSYPNFEAARFWCASAFVAALSIGCTLLRASMDPILPIIVGNAFIVLACCLGAMGIRRFYHKPVSWMTTLAITAASTIGLSIFLLWQDNVAMRIVIVSMGQSVPLALTLKYLLSRNDATSSPGARLAGYMTLLIVTVNLARSVFALAGPGGSDALAVAFNGFQAVMIVLLVFSAMVWNFGFMLMAMDRLRAEVANLALFDDLTGIANRRQFSIRLADECARARRGADPFTLLAIDLDGFKAINDNFGHAAGDDCLKEIAGLMQARLRATDLLARFGGDEFVALVPSSRAHDAGYIAADLLEICRRQMMRSNGHPIKVSASIGIAEWSKTANSSPELLMAAADQAMYEAKQRGKNRYVAAKPSSVTPMRLSA